MRSFVLAIAALLLVASCTDDPEPIEPKPTASPKPTATAPALPTEATKETPDGSIAFVAHWIDVFNFSANSGDLTALRELNGPDCEGCEIYDDIVADANRGSAEVRGFRWSPGKAHLSKEQQLVVTIRSSPYKVRESASDEWSEIRGDSYQLGFDLEWSDGRWHVAELYQPEADG